MLWFWACAPVAPPPPIHAARAPPSEIETGFVVIDIGSGDVVTAKSPDKGFIPASTLKLITAIAARDTLPPDFRYITRLCATSPVKEDGGIDGDLILLGGGDPTLKLKDLLTLAEWLSRNITGISGRFVVDPGRYPNIPSISIHQPREAVYNSGIAGLIVSENAVRAERAGSKSWTVPLNLYQAPRLSTNQWFPALSPDLHAGRVFRHYTNRMGSALPDPTRAHLACPVELTRIVSPPRDALIGEMLEKSSNPMAEMIGITVDRARGASFRSLADTAQGTLTWLDERFSEIDWEGARLPNHSGLSTRARLSPRQLAGLLAAAYRDPNIAFSPAMLTPAGWLGHLKGRLVGAETAALVWAKTGTMHYGVGLAGYLLPQDGKVQSFAIFAIDRDARAAYDELGPNPGEQAEQAAEAWNAKAQRRIDAIVESWMKTS